MTGEQPPVLAVRVRKARASSVCGLCIAIIKIGNQIGKVRGKGWCHTSCIIRSSQPPAEGEQP